MKSFLRKIISKTYQLVLPIIKKVYLLSDSIHYKSKKQTNVLYAFYNLQVCAPTFDIVKFLVLAEQERIKYKCKSMHVIIVPDKKNSFTKKAIKKTKGTTYGDVFDSLEWRLRNILVPCCWHMPSCKEITVCGSQEEALALEASVVKFSFPKNNTIRYPRRFYLVSHLIEGMKKSKLPSIKATAQAKTYINNWIIKNAGDRKIITITLREYELYPERNSSLKDWGKFARDLDLNKYFPVILRDTDKSFDDIPKELTSLTIFNEAVWNIELRAALYELSYLNMSVPNGPHTLFTMNKKTRYIMIKFVTESVKYSSREFFESMGMNYGEDLPWATTLQKCVWEDDNYEIIKGSFDEMCQKIEGYNKRNRQTTLEKSNDY